MMKSVHGLMLLACLFWAGAFITGKWAIQEVNPITLTFLRFGVALPFIFAILWKWEPHNLVPKKEQWPPLIALGLIGTLGYHALFFTALNYTTAINASLIGSSLPSITAILGILLGIEKIRPSRLLGISIAFLGIIAIITDGDIAVLKTLAFNQGDLLMLSAVLSWAIYTLLSRLYLGKYHISPVVATAYTFLVCVLACLPYSLWSLSMGVWEQITLQGWLSILYMAIFSSVLGYLFNMIALQELGPSRTVIFVNLVPILTIAMAVVLLGETVTPFKLAISGLIIAGIYTVTRED